MGPTCGVVLNGRRGWATAGTRYVPDTLRKMQAHIRQAVTMRPVVEFTAGLLRAVPGRSYEQRAKLIRSYLASHFIFAPDPHGVELLRCPDFLLSEIGRKGWVAGDCDDAAVLAGTLGVAGGFPVQLVAVAFDPTKKRYQHVYAVLIGPRGEQYEMDFTRSGQVLPSQVTGIMTLNV